MIISLDTSYIRKICEIEKETILDKNTYYTHTEIEFETMFQNPLCFPFGYFVLNELVGWGMFEIHEKYIEIGPVIIGGRFQSKGYGRGLCTFLLEESKKYNLPIRLTVYPKNISAIKLYKQLGFVKYDFKQDYYGVGKDRVLMEYTPTKNT